MANLPQSRPFSDIMKFFENQKCCNADISASGAIDSNSGFGQVRPLCYSCYTCFTLLDRFQVIRYFYVGFDFPTGGESLVVLEIMTQASGNVCIGQQ